MPSVLHPTEADFRRVGDTAIFVASAVAAAQRNKTRLAGAFADKPLNVRTAGVFAAKPVQVKVGGVFV